MRARFPALLLGVALAGTPVAVHPAAAAPPAAAPAAAAAAAARAAGCDPADPAACLLPFPSDVHTVPDPGTATGLRVALDPRATPANAAGTRVDPGEWNRNDGFSPGSAPLTVVPGLDPARTGLAPQTDIGRSLRPDAPIVLLDTRTGGRHPYWAELDAGGTGDRRALIVRPARGLDEATRYVVALRTMRDAAGRPLPPDPVWRAVSGPVPPADPALRRRWEQARRVLTALAAAGLPTDGLHLAWDFTTASRRNLSERMLRLRDDAFERLGARAPAYRVTGVTDYTPQQNPYVRRVVEGRIVVPSYLDRYLGPPGSRLHYGPDGLPARRPGNVQLAPFVCTVPRSATGDTPARPTLYGHGLLGDPAEVTAPRLQQYADESRQILCGTPWIGMSSKDVPVVLAALAEFSRFPAIPDRIQQGFLDFLFLGRAMAHPRGLAAADAFRDGDRPLLRTGPGQLVYVGNSQGGILGGGLTAVARDFTRASLGVPGTTFSLLLDRSVQFDRFRPVFARSYPDPVDRQLVLQLSQMLWDRGEVGGYARHLTTDPLPGTPPHEVLLVEAFGDHQVANVSTEVLARTVPGLRLREPALAPGRSLDAEPFWGIPRQTRFPYAGSALVVVDSGSPPAPPGNVPPRAGLDPHGHPINAPELRALVARFLTTGDVVDTCEGRPCTAPVE